MIKIIEMPFGANDSELTQWEMTIPEGMEAEIKDGKVVLRRVESDDERIRAYVIRVVKDWWREIAVVTDDGKWPTEEEMLAYLEKQKELFESGIGLYYYDGEKTTYLGEITPQMDNKAADEVLREERKDSKVVAFGTDAHADGMYGSIADTEQKPAEWSEDYQEEDLRTRFAFYTYKDEDDVLYLSNVFVEETSRNKGFGTKILAAAEKVAETLGAINIRLKVKKNSPANAWYRKNGYGYSTFEGDYDWLEKTLEYLKPSKKEWSEEDDALLKEIVSFFKDGTVKLQHDLDLYAGFLENKFTSLRPQPHWKPSDEQIRPLEYAIDYFKKKKNDTTYLESLYNDLKKL